MGYEGNLFRPRIDPVVISAPTLSLSLALSIFLWETFNCVPRAAASFDDGKGASRRKERNGRKREQGGKLVDGKEKTRRLARLDTYIALSRSSNSIVSVNKIVTRGDEEPVLQSRDAGIQGNGTSVWNRETALDACAKKSFVERGYLILAKLNFYLRILFIFIYFVKRQKL